MKLRPFALAMILLTGMQSFAVAQSSFPHGVGSGDVTADAAILWTRTTPGEVRVDVSRDGAFSQIVAQAVLLATNDADGTLKLDATGLTPGTPYLYRFVRLDSGESSQIGMFRTAPAPDDMSGFRFVYTGDSNGEFHPFTILRHAAEASPDLWFWAGDTCYADAILQGLPPAVDLPGYREKHRQNREDAHLRNLLAISPVWAQWDDHEVSNDYDGGDLEPRISLQQRNEAYRAFFEYMPIRPQAAVGDEFRTYRSVRYGALAEFFLLDCRQYRSRDVGRDGGGPDPRAFLLPTLEIDTIIRLADPSRSMLGAEQLAWLKEGLRSSTARHKFILSSLPFTSLLFLPYDRWDGYVAERYDLLRFIDENNIPGVILLAADIHSNLHNPDVTKFLRETLQQKFSPCFRVPEFVAGPIGVDTFQQEVGIIGSLIFDTPLAEFESSFFFRSLFDFVMWRVRAGNGLSFIEPNRFTFLQVDVTPDGVSFTYKGIPPNPDITDAALETLYTTSLPQPPEQGCAPGFLSPICMCGIMGFAINGRRRRPSATFKV